MITSSTEMKGCSWCDEIIRAIDWEAHHTQPDHLKECMYCPDKIPFDQLKDHEQYNCKQRDVALYDEPLHGYQKPPKGKGAKPNIWNEYVKSVMAEGYSFKEALKVASQRKKEQKK